MSAVPNTTAEPVPTSAAVPSVEESKAAPPAPTPATEPVQTTAESAPVAVPTTETKISDAATEESKAAPAQEPAVAAAAPAVPEKEVVKPTAESPATALSKLFAELPAIIKEADHKEIWGVELSDESHVPTTIVLEKFLRANTKDVSKARAQLIKALAWRKKMNPAELLTNTQFDKSKFGDLGFVTTYSTDKGKEIITWNIYGAVKDNKATFGNVEEFIKWRSALMELSVRELDLPSATTKIPEDGIDPYRMVQVHDYLNVSFLRMDPATKAASKETIQTFSMAYPELLKEKFFVNVPVLMGWVFSAMKLFLAPETIKKFHPLSYGKNLAGELPGFGDQLPPAYGGKGNDIKSGLAVKYAETTAPSETAPAATDIAPTTTPAAAPETAPTAPIDASANTPVDAAAPAVVPSEEPAKDTPKVAAV
ncbi:phosphatidylinositol transfer protein sfh5 [Phlyctema vagabunda]|uniref:Phosphatidylinositol transfer protein SFH5 n=1 Tax=Phlyctema vagabunda TaxID=108571 RepID=A0ABR4PIP9_9HELO